MPVWLNVSLAPVQRVKNGCFPLVLNLLPDRIDWNGNPPSWPRLVQNKNSSFFTARSNSPSFHFPGRKKRTIGEIVFLKMFRLNQREIFVGTFGWRIVISTTFRLQFPTPELKTHKRDRLGFTSTSQKHTAKTN